MDRLLAVEEVAGILNCHPQSIYENLDEIEHIRTLNNSIRFRESDIEQYLKQRTIKPVSASSELQRLARYAKVEPKGDDNAMSKKRRRWSYGHGFGGVYVRQTSKGEDKYYIWFYDENRARQREVVKGAINKKQAEVALYSRVREVFDKKYGNGKAEKRITFADFAQEYLETHARVKKKSFKSDERYLATHLVPHFGKLDLSEIAPLHVQNFIAKKLDAGIQKNSVNRYLQIMHSMLNIAKRYGYSVCENPFPKAFKEDEFRRKRILTHEEEPRLFKELSAHLKPVIRYALLSGCRKQEVLGLQRGDIDLGKDVIAIQPRLNKSGKLDIIPIHSELKEFLLGHLKANGKVDNVFNYTDRSTGEVKPLKNISTGFYGACRRAGIKDLQFRDLRTTCATRWHEKGVDPLVISRAVLRHSSLKMSEQLYIHSSVEHMKEALDGAKLTHH